MTRRNSSRTAGLKTLSGLAVLLFVPTVAQAQLALDWYTTAAGAGTSTGGGFEVTGTIGQSGAASMAAIDLMIDSGFWSILPRGAGTIRSVRTLPGPQRIKVTWESHGAAPGLTGFQLRKRQPRFEPGNFRHMANVPYNGPGSYEASISSIAGDDTQIQILERYQSGVTIPRVVTIGRSYTNFLPPNTARVSQFGGGAGAFRDIGAAIAAATGPDWLITVASGSYPAFSIDGNAPKNLRIIADDTSNVWINTNDGPVSIENRQADQVTELRGLRIGRETTVHPGLRIQSATGVVILDSSIIQGGVNQPGLELDGATSVALQRTELLGTPGLLASNASKTIVGRGSIDALILEGNSQATLCGLSTNQPTVETGSTLTKLIGVMPDLQVQAFGIAQAPVRLDLETFPTGGYALFAATGNTWTEIPGFEMALLLSPLAINALVIDVADQQGRAALSVAIPADPSLRGVPFAMQFASAHPTTGQLRMSNTQTFAIFN